jgi:hypothetical protein
VKKLGGIRGEVFKKSYTKTHSGFSFFQKNRGDKRGEKKFNFQKKQVKCRNVRSRIHIFSLFVKKKSGFFTFLQKCIIGTVFPALKLVQDLNEFLKKCLANSHCFVKILKKLQKR